MYAMQKFHLRLISASGEVRHEHSFGSKGGSDLWRATSDSADRFGRSGEFLQIFDEAGGMVIGVGVATARSSSTSAGAAV
jgi:hypothetical protein